MSNSSEVSPLSSPDLRSEDIVFSARPSPGLTIDNPQSPRSSQRYLRSSMWTMVIDGLRPQPEGQVTVACYLGLQWSRTLMLSGAATWAPEAPGAPSEAGTRSSPRSTNADESSLSGHARSTPVRSQPIAIELPTTKKPITSSAPVCTPPAPLSARGDLPGGYFPLHEEQARVYRPHPFQLDATKARMKSIQRASKDSPSDLPASDHDIAREEAGLATTNVPPTRADRTMQIPQLNMNSLVRPESTSASNTPVASYMPLGDQSSPLPMGKYYPSNYERRKNEKRKGKKHRPTSDPTLFNSIKSESQVPTLNQTPTMGHSRNESEAKRRLQQYQRDMIAQATIALNGGNLNPATLSSLRSLGFSNIAKPSKPRLGPARSPGPIITPMELEGHTDSTEGYLGAHGVVDAQAEVNRVIRAEEERRRREGATSPAVELGPSTL
ncbi:hypothetical protein HD806DRAFT_520102 [Xylariaceae sp. AK1471]|nr:hypothetical protein HD806DRAFT_520102 [Xylariaceae sp. AK1471]